MYIYIKLDRKNLNLGINWVSCVFLVVCYDKGYIYCFCSVFLIK